MYTWICWLDASHEGCEYARSSKSTFNDESIALQI